MSASVVKDNYVREVWKVVGLSPSQMSRVLRKGGNMILYTADWCSGCKAVKAIMDSVGISYETINIDERELTPEEAKNIRGLPTLKRNGVYITGVDKIKESLRNF